MQLDTRIPLGFQSPDLVNALAQGQQAGQQANEFRHTNALRAAVQQHGAGLVSGDPMARNALAGFDPMMVQQADANRQSYRQNEQAAQMAFQNAQQKAREIAAGISAQERQQLRAEFEQGANMIAAAQTPEQFAQVAQAPGVREAVEAFLGPNMLSFENRQIIASAALGAAEALKVTAGPEQRVSEVGLQPVFGRDADGNVVILQLSKDGTAVRTQVPEGVTPAPCEKLIPPSGETERLVAEPTPPCAINC